MKQVLPLVVMMVLADTTVKAFSEKSVWFKIKYSRRLPGHILALPPFAMVMSAQWPHKTRQVNTATQKRVISSRV